MPVTPVVVPPAGVVPEGRLPVGAPTDVSVQPAGVVPDGMLPDAAGVAGGAAGAVVGAGAGGGGFGAADEAGAPANAKAATASDVTAADAVVLVPIRSSLHGRWDVRAQLP